MGKTIGIDLGTTNSCVAYLENGNAVVIPNAEGGRTTPSVVAFSKDGQRLVGAQAKRQAVTNSERTIYSIKRDMGTNNTTTIDKKQYTPEEISAMILQKLKADAEAYLGETVSDAVITVPAYFSDGQRQATKNAGHIAGLNVLRIINEPTAAAFAYGVDKGVAQKIMVFDLGGGTFDVSLLDINQDVIEVLATAGNNRLGGDDFDNCLTTYIAAAFEKQEHVQITQNIPVMSRIKEAAEKAKIELSSTTSTQVSLPFLMADANGAKHLELTITRATFDQLTAHLVEATKGPVDQVLSDAVLSPSDIQRVLLVGGSTRIPAVQASVRKRMGKEPGRDINPDECVCMGAALQGGVLQGDVKGLLLLDVTPLSLGIETMGDVFSRIIERNTTLPVQQSQIFTTAANFQTSVDIHVLQGEREIASVNKTLGRFRLSGIKRAMRGVPQIEVTFSIDANGIVNVAAKDLATGKRQDITLTQSSHMSQADIDKAVQDAQRYAQDDKKRKESAEIKNQAETLLYQAKDALKGLSSQDKSQLESLRKKLQTAVDNGNETDIKIAMEALTKAMEAVHRYTNQDAGAEDGAMDASYQSSHSQEK